MFCATFFGFDEMPRGAQPKAHVAPRAFRLKGIGNKDVVHRLLNQLVEGGANLLGSLGKRSRQIDRVEVVSKILQHLQAFC